MSLEIRSLGSGIALQDAGRVGWRRYGVPPGGAMDRRALRAANHLLGNRGDAPVLELLLRGASIEVLEDTWVAVAGADACANVSAWTAREVKAGEVLAFTKKAAGLFTYLAVPGGFVAERWFGSVSVDARNGLGGALKVGQCLAPQCAESNRSPSGVVRRVLADDARCGYAATATLNLLPGPQFDHFSGAAKDALIASAWTVSTRSDRTGYRLDGAGLEVPDSIPSEPVLPGSFQVTGNGQPIVTMVDGPTVGGYPKIAVLCDADRDRLAQCAPGTQLNFQWAEF
ncbi:MAG: biotin-dependent carboxyltransferase family protein [Opitutales bacterium]